MMVSDSSMRMLSNKFVKLVKIVFQFLPTMIYKRTGS